MIGLNCNPVCTTDCKDAKYAELIPASDQVASLYIQNPESSVDIELITRIYIMSQISVRF
jgi:hypothetical protein